MNKDIASDVIEYKTRTQEYHKKCLKAKERHWRQTTTELEEIKDVARIQKFFEGKVSNKIATIKKPSGVFTKDENETVTELMKHHFPGCEIYEEE